jgi:tetratricopeptide (TPR) repeat protein
MGRAKALAAAGAVWLAVAPAALAQPVNLPPQQAHAGKPPWQRLLQGEDARKAAELKAQEYRLRDAGRFEEALAAAEALAKLRENVQGADHWQAADARWLAEALHRALRRGARGRADYARGESLTRQAAILVDKGRYREAQALFEQVLASWRDLFGEEHPYTAVGYINLANNLGLQGKHTEAAPLYRKALATCRKVLGEEHPHTAVGEAHVAGVAEDQGKYAEATAGRRKALAIYRKVLGEEDPRTADGYNGLAYNLSRRGRSAEAEARYRKALAIYRKALGEDDFGTARGYNNLASALNAQGKYAEAVVGYRKALAFCRKVLGEEHPITATSCNNVADNLNAQGQYAAAEPLFRKALAIRLKGLGEGHADTATSYHNLAANLTFLGSYTESAANGRKALAVWRKALGEGHPLTAAGYDGVALGLQRQRRYTEADADFRKALAIRLQTLPAEHPDTARTYNRLANNLDAPGKYAEAAEFHRRALAIFRKVLGEAHPDTARTYDDLAHNLYARGKYAEAEGTWADAADSFARARLRIAASGLGRATRTGHDSPLPAFAAVLARNGKPEAAWRRYEEGLARGTWDDLSARLRRPPEEQARQAELVAQLDRLDRLIEQALSVKEPSAAQQQRRKDLLTQRGRAQDELDAFASHLEEVYGPAAGQVFDRKTIQAALPPDAALIGWLDRGGLPRAENPNGEHWAVLLRSAGPPVWVKLRGSGPEGTWSEADGRLPGQLRAALQSRRGAWQPLARRLRQQRLSRLTKYLAAHDGLPAVRRLIVLPSTALAGVPAETFAGDYTVAYALSGTLYVHLRRQPVLTTRGLLALADPAFDPPPPAQEPLPLPPGGVLLTMVSPGSNAARAGLRANDVLLRYGNTDLSGPADLPPLTASGGDGTPVTLVVWRDGKTRKCQVRPGRLGLVLAGEPAPRALAEQRHWDRKMAALSRGGDWAPLPGTRVEVEALRRLFDQAGVPAKALTDSQASEQRLYELAKDLGTYRYLHLATHGEVDDRVPLRSAVILARDNLPDPLKQLQAGLPVFDGRLTADKVLRQWHLHSELVTLSACQTALGKYERGEGYVGFAQALLLAGSRSVCLSLWKVDDAATALLMERVYQNLLGRREALAGPLGKAAALREAKQWLRALPREEALRRVAHLSQGVARAKGRKALPLLPAVPEPPAGGGAGADRPYGHPYYWAAFVLIGDPD